MSSPASTRRAAPRAAVELPVTLVRGRGKPIASRTVDVGRGGMRVCSERPLGIDELLGFDLVWEGAHVEGRARVLREDVGSTYALRFEALRPQATDALGRLLAGSGLV
jgi:hypothetical protein